jgi:hypothetical protein
MKAARATLTQRKAEIRVPTPEFSYLLVAVVFKLLIFSCVPCPP